MRRPFVLFGVLLLLGGCMAAGGTPQPSPGMDATPSPTEMPTVRPSPTADTWVQAGEFNDYRVVTQLALLGTGEVLAVGADNVCGVESAGSDTAELGDPEAGTWTMTSRLPTPRNFPVMVALADGRALVTGGANAEYVAKSSTVVFDPATATWSSSGLLNTARIYPGIAALPDGRVIVAGGLLINKSQEGGALDTAEIWDPMTGAWSRAAKLSGARQGPTAVTLTDGRVLLVGGLPRWGADVERPTAEMYDPTTGRWTAAGSLGSPPSGLSLVALPDGGALAVRSDAHDRVIVERYDAATNDWSTADYLELPSGVVRAVVASLQDGRVLVVGGPDARTYDPATGSWSETTPLPEVRSDASAVLLPDGSVLVGGGWSEGPNPGDAPGCPTANPQLWRFVPGMP